MFGQGVLGWMLFVAITLAIFPNSLAAYIVMGGIGGGLVGLCAYLGKYYLVDSFNNPQWIAMGEKTWGGIFLRPWAVGVKME